MVNQDVHNQYAVKEAGIYQAITNSFKRLIKYGQKQDIKQEAVTKSLSALLNMSVQDKNQKKTNLQNPEALFCSLQCIKVLLKSKTTNNYSESLNLLC